MPGWIEFVAIVLVFLLGVRLSAFFSGTETGYYRLSLPRLMIDAQAGERRAARLLWFAERPARFMATTLIGNNLANYVITCAVSWGVVFVAAHPSEWVEILMTVAISPVIFLLGELLPKSVYYRAPLRFLRKDVKWMRICSILFLPASLPLVGVAKLVERVRPGPDSLETVLGRSRLAQIMSHGHREGVLSDAQTRLAANLLRIGPQPILGSMTPADRVLGVDSTCDRAAILEHAQRYGLALVAIHSPQSTTDWFAYVRVSELTLINRPVASLIRQSPRIPHTAHKIEAMHTLRESGEEMGAVVDGDRVLGIISQRGLSEQLFRQSHVGHAGA